ncbi:MAG: cupredoxin domain-containing protein [Rhodanobacteraceae bacterium]
MICRTLVVILAFGLLSSAAFAAGMPQYKLTIKDHRFAPTQLTVPANTQFKVLVHNQDSTPSEFESSDFNREKIVLPGNQITVFIGPLDKGHYKFFDDFHQDTGQGVLIVQ